MSRLSRSALLAAGLWAALAAPATAAPPVPSLAADTRFAPPSGIAKFDFTTGTAADVTGGVVVVGERIYTVGETRDSTGDADIAIIARRPDGTFDTGFSEDGRMTVAIAQNVGTNKGRDAGFAVAALPDGRLRLAAAVDVDTGSGINLDVAVAGVTPEGALDLSFGGGDGHVTFPVGTANDTPTRMALDPAGRIAVTGTAVIGGKDDFFVSVREPDGAPAAFGVNGIKSFNRAGVGGANVAMNDRGTDVLFTPSGGVLALLQVETNPADSANDWHAVLHAFTPDGSDDPAFDAEGDLDLAVGTPDTIPGGMIVYDDRLWVTGSTKTGVDTDAFLARLNLDGGGLESRRFDMRGTAAGADTAVTSQGNDLTVVPGVPPTLVVGGFTTSDAGTDWAAAAFNDLTAGVGAFGTDDTVLATPGQGTIVGLSPGPGPWAAAGGSLLDLNSADTSFGMAKLLVDADKECDLSLEIQRPLDVVFTSGRRVPLTVRITNVGTRACGGRFTVAPPYVLDRNGAVGPVFVDTIAAGDAATFSDMVLRYTGEQRRGDTLLFQLTATDDDNAANNTRAVRVSFRYCDLRLEAFGRPWIPRDGSVRIPVEVRNGGTGRCAKIALGVASGGRVAGAPSRFGIDGGRSASETVSVAASKGAKLGSTLSLVLRARAGSDENPDNDTATIAPVVVKAGSARISRRGARGLRGRASRGGGKLPASLRRVRSVDVAVRRAAGKQCAWLASKGGTRLRKRSCSAEVWLRARGTSSWRLALKRSLPPGRYTAFARATVGGGLRGPASPAATFTVR